VFDTTTAELASRDDDAVHIAAFFGDTNGSGTYNSPDTTLVQRVITQVNSGFAAYQLADPVLLADITQNGLLQSSDTTLIRRVITQVPVPNVPPLPTGVPFPGNGGPDPRLFLPRDLSARAGDTVTVPVLLTVTDRAGISLGGADLVITYDASRFSVSNVRLGSLLAGSGFAFAANTATAGQILLSMDSGSTATLALGTTGSMFLVDFTVRAGAASGASLLNLRRDWQGLRTALFDRDTHDLVLLPAPTNAGDDAVDGLIRVQAASPLPPAAGPLPDPRTSPDAVTVGSLFLGGALSSGVVAPTSEKAMPTAPEATARSLGIPVNEGASVTFRLVADELFSGVGRAPRSRGILADPGAVAMTLDALSLAGGWDASWVAPSDGHPR
jgi:hypothetical protein